MVSSNALILLKRFFTSLFLVVLSHIGLAQITPVQVTPQLLPPYSLQVSDYYSGVQPKLQVMLLNRDINQPVIRVRLRMTVESQNCRMRTRPNAVTPVFTLTNGVPYYLTPQDLQAFFLASNLEIGGGYSEQQYVQTGRLPEGLYSIYFEAFEEVTGNLVSNKGFSLGWLTLAEPPILNTPARNEDVKPGTPQNIVFNWTPRHNTSVTAGYYTDYVFTIVEYLDSYMSPDAAFTANPPLFIDSVQNTTYLMGAAHPQLIPGRRYAWRVQAKSKDGSNQPVMFRNNGFSEVFVFNYRNNCNAPLGIISSINGQRASIEWQNDPMHLEWRVEYREKNNPKAEWFSLSNTLPRVLITDLKPGTQYEYRVGGACIAANFVYSPLGSFTTAGFNQNYMPGCGDTILPAPGSGNPRQTLVAGDSIQAGSFTVYVGYVTGTGSFSGQGYVIVPWLANAKVEVQFSNITVSEDKKLLTGEITTTYDPTESGIDDIDEYIDIFKAGMGVGDVITGLNQADTTFNFEIAGPGSINVVLPPSYNPQTGKGTEPISITVQPVPSSGPGGSTPAPANYTVDSLPTTLKDAKDNVFKVNQDGQVVQIASGDGKSLLQNANTKKIDSDKGEVHFIDYPEKQKYAFDGWKEVYKKSSTFNKEYERLENYYVSQKAIAPSETDFIKAQVELKDSSINPRDIEFVSGTGVKYVKKALDSTYTLYEIEVIGGPASDAQEIYALYKPTGSKTLNLGKIKVSSYSKIEKEITIVLVNNITVDQTQIIEGINDVFKPIGITFNVKFVSLTPSVSFDLNNDGKLAIKSTNFGAFTTEMKKLNDQFLSSSVSTNSDLVFFVLNLSDSAGVSGMMPRGKRFGYIFKGESPQNLPRVIAHEIGHGLFRFKHTFDYNNQQGLWSFNLMDYPHGDNLAKYQWDVSRDVPLIVQLFEKKGGVWSVEENKLRQFNNYSNSSNSFYLAPNGKFIRNDIQDLTLLISSDGEFDYIILGLKIGQATHLARFDAESNEFLGYGNLNLDDILIQVPGANNSANIVSYSGQACFFRKAEISNWLPADVLGSNVFGVISEIEKKAENSQWVSQYYYDKNPNSIECQNRATVDTSAIKNEFKDAAIQKILSIISPSKVSSLTKRAIGIDFAIFLTYSDSLKNKKVLKTENFYGADVLFIDDQQFVPNDSKVTIWIEIQNDQTAKLKFFYIGLYLKDNIGFKLNEFGHAIDWIQMSKFERAINISGQFWDKTLDFAIDILDFLSSTVQIFKVPPRFYDTSLPDYDETGAILFGFLIPIELIDYDLLNSPIFSNLSDFLQGRNGNINQLRASETSKITFAVVSGIYNGLIDVVSSIPDISKMIVSIFKTDFAERTKSSFTSFQEIYVLNDFDNRDTILKADANFFIKVMFFVNRGFAEMFPTDEKKRCLFVHNLFSVVGPTIIILTTGNFSTIKNSFGPFLSRTIQILKWCDDFGFRELGFAARYLAKSSGRLGSQIFKQVANSIEVIIEQIEDNLYKVAVVNKAGVKSLIDMTQDQLGLILDALPYRLSPNYFNRFEYKIDLPGLTSPSSNSLITSIVSKTSGSISEELIDALLKTGISFKKLSELADIFSSNSNLYIKLNKAFVEKFDGDEALIRQFFNALHDGLPSQPNALLSAFMSSKGDLVDVWNVMNTTKKSKFLKNTVIVKGIQDLFENDKLISSLQSIYGEKFKTRLITIANNVLNQKGGQANIENLIKELNEYLVKSSENPLSRDIIENLGSSDFDIAGFLLAKVPWASSFPRLASNLNLFKKLNLVIKQVDDYISVEDALGREVFVIFKENGREIFQVSDDFFEFVEGVDPIVIKGFELRTNSGEVINGAKVFLTSNGGVGFVEDLSAYSGKVLETIRLRGKLRSTIPNILGSEEAHHIIPIALLKRNRWVQKAVEGGFEFNEAIFNGIPLEKFKKATNTGRHGPHPSYTNRIEFYINAFEGILDENGKTFADLTPEELANKFRNISNSIRNKIQSTTGNINSISTIP